MSLHLGSHVIKRTAGRLRDLKICLLIVDALQVLEPGHGLGFGSLEAQPGEPVAPDRDRHGRGAAGTPILDQVDSR
jgi:hypothetical protein